LECRSNGPTETERLGEQLGGIVEVGSIICLAGPLGVGKTTLTKGLAAGLGICDPLTSPTYTIIREYTGGRLPLYHMDLYRLATASECDELGLDDYFYGDGVCVIEWPEKYAQWMPDDRIDVRIKRASDDRRIIAIRSIGERSAAIVERWGRA